MKLLNAFYIEYFEIFNLNLIIKIPYHPFEITLEIILRSSNKNIYNKYFLEKKIFLIVIYCIRKFLPICNWDKNPKLMERYLFCKSFTFISSSKFLTGSHFILPVSSSSSKLQFTRHHMLCILKAIPLCISRCLFLFRVVFCWGEKACERRKKMIKFCCKRKMFIQSTVLEVSLPPF